MGTMVVYGLTWSGRISNIHTSLGNKKDRHLIQYPKISTNIRHS
jgi:hypothetical protein